MESVRVCSYRNHEIGKRGSVIAVRPHFSKMDLETNSIASVKGPGGENSCL